MKQPKPKTLASLRDRSKGAIHHMEIYPVGNGRGGRSFLSTVHRKPTKAARAKAQASGEFCPECMPETETFHQGGTDMVDHVQKKFGITPDDGDSDDDSDSDGD